MSTTVFWLLGASLVWVRIGVAQLTTQLEGPTCDVIAAGLNVALKTSDDLRITRRANYPWSYFNQLPPENRARLLARVQSDLEAPESLVEKLLAQRDRSTELPPCEARLQRTTWLPDFPESASDTTVVGMSLPVFNAQGDRALVYIGWSNRWVGRGDFYLLERRQATWTIVRSAGAWVQ